MAPYDGGDAMNDDELEIRGVLADFTRAIHDKDATQAIASLSDDEVTFDLAPPLRHGPDTTHDTASLEEWFETWRTPIISESHDLIVAVGGDVAYAYGVQHMTGTKKDGENVDLWFRATACFRREDGRWRITHMHNSVPFAMDGSAKALLDLKPSER
jgi:ketosteroid isomerase-like protein